MIYPRNAAMRNDLGLALLAHGDAKGAVDELRKAVALRPDVAKLRNHLGFAIRVLRPRGSRVPRELG